MDKDKFEQIKTKMDDKMLEHGWIAHLVFSEDGIHANYHTHGLEENYNHPDLQISLNINPDLAHKLLSVVADRIKEGEKFESQKKYDKIIGGNDVEMRQFTEGERDVLRIILPDPEGKFPGDSDCDLNYKTQYDDFDKKQRSH